MKSTYFITGSMTNKSVSDKQYLFLHM